MPGAGVVHHIIFDRSCGLRLPLDVCFPPKAARTLNDAMGQSTKSLRDS